MTKTKMFTYCNDELEDDPVTQAYINDPRAGYVLRHMDTNNREGIRIGRWGRQQMGMRPSAHIRITPPSLKIAERLKKECNIMVFPAQFSNKSTAYKSDGIPSWYMYVLEYQGKNTEGTIGSDWRVRELLTCKEPLTVNRFSLFDFEVIPSRNDEQVLHQRAVARYNRGGRV